MGLTVAADVYGAAVIDMALMSLLAARLSRKLTLIVTAGRQNTIRTNGTLATQLLGADILLPPPVDCNSDVAF